MTKKLFLADHSKLVPGDIIYALGVKHTIESIRKCGQQIIQSITTGTHHLGPIDIYTTDKSKV